MIELVTVIVSWTVVTIVGTSPVEILFMVVPETVAVTVAIERVPDGDRELGGRTVVIVEVSVSTDGEVITTIRVMAIGAVVVRISTLWLVVTTV
jgi:hypothetical protein